MGQDGVEAFFVEVVEDDIVPGGLEFFDRGLGDGVAVAAFVLMAEDYEYVHWDNPKGSVIRAEQPG